MPGVALTADEIRDIVAYIVTPQAERLRGMAQVGRAKARYEPYGT